MLPEWCSGRPATTIVGTKVIAGPGTSVFAKGGVSRQDRPGAYVASPEQLGLLQSYTGGFRWGVRAAEQAGNAVPPPVAAAVFKGLWA